MALISRDSADPWGYRAALTLPGAVAMCLMAGKLGPWNGMDWISGSSTYLVCAAMSTLVQRIVYSAPDNWSNYQCVCDRQGIMMSTLGGGTQQFFQPHPMGPAHFQHPSLLHQKPWATLQHASTNVVSLLSTTGMPRFASNLIRDNWL